MIRSEFDYNQDLVKCAKSEDGLHTWGMLSDSLTFFCHDCGIRPPESDSKKIIPYAHRCPAHHKLVQHDGKVIGVIHRPLDSLIMRQREERSIDD